jgi:hypothetical protein
MTDQVSNSFGAQHRVEKNADACGQGGWTPPTIDAARAFALRSCG